MVSYIQCGHLFELSGFRKAKCSICSGLTEITGSWTRRFSSEALVFVDLLENSVSDYTVHVAWILAIIKLIVFVIRPVNNRGALRVPLIVAYRIRTERIARSTISTCEDFNRRPEEHISMRSSATSSYNYHKRKEINIISNQDSNCKMVEPRIPVSLCRQMGATSHCWHLLKKLKNIMIIIHWQQLRSDLFHFV